MARKRFFRIKTAGLFDIEERYIEKMAQKGWTPESLSKYMITFKKTDECALRCRLVYYEVADPSYNKFVSETQETGWRYVSNDGVSQTMLITRGGDEVPEISIPEKEAPIIRRHRGVKAFLVVLGAIALAWVILKKIQDGGLLESNRVFIYAAWLLLIVQWVAACVSETRNLNIVNGTAKRRDSSFAYWFHAILLALIIVLLAIAAVIVFMN